MIQINKKIGLIVIDNPHRELDGIKRLKKEFSTKNYWIIICSKLDLIDYLKFIKPDFVICPKPNYPFSNIKTKYKKNITFFCLPCEHGFGLSPKVLNHFGEDPNTPLYIGNESLENPKDDWEAIFLPSHKHKNILEKTNNYDSRKLIVTGNLNSDNWLINYKKVKSGNFLKSRKSKKVGISTTFKNFLFGITYKSPLVGLYEHTNFKEDVWRLDFLRYEMEYARLLILLIKKIKDIDFVIRPHPHESRYNWRKLCEIIPNLEISRDINLIDWLSDKAICINSFSTTSIDSVMQGIPSLSLDKMIANDTYERLPNTRKPFKANFSYRPNTLEKAEEIIREKIENYNIEDNQRFLDCFNEFKDFFYLDRNESASKIIERFITKKSNINLNKNKKSCLLNLKLFYIYLRACYRYYKSNRKECLLNPNIVLRENLKFR